MADDLYDGLEDTPKAGATATAEKPKDLYDGLEDVPKGQEAPPPAPVTPDITSHPSYPALAGASFVASTRDPAHYAQLTQESQKTGVPVTILENAEGKPVPAVDPPNPKDIQDLINNYPGLSKYLADQHNASISSDDHDTLKGIENNEKDASYTDMLLSGYHSAMASTHRIPEEAVGLAALPGNAINRAIGNPQFNPESIYKGGRNPWAEYEDALAKSYPQAQSGMDPMEEANLKQAVASWDPMKMTDQLLRLNHPGQAAEYLTKQMVGAIPQMAPTLVFSALKYARLGIGLMSAQTGAGAQHEALESGQAPDVSAIRGAGYAATNEMAMGTAATNILEKSAQTIYKTHGLPGLQNLAKQFGDLASHSAAVGGGGMSGMTLGNAIVDVGTGQDPDALKPENLFPKMASSFTIGAGMGIGMGSVGLAANAKDFFLAHGELHDQAKNTTRSPQDQQAAEAAILKGTPHENAFFTKTAIDEHFQKQELDPKQEMTKLGLGDAYDKANETEGHVVVPMAEATGKMPSEMYKALADHVTFPDKNGEIPPTVAEAKKQGEELRAQGEAGKPTKEQGAIETRLDEMQAGIKKQLMDSGSTEKVAEDQSIQDRAKYGKLLKTPGLSEEHKQAILDSLPSIKGVEKIEPGSTGLKQEASKMPKEEKESKNAKFKREALKRMLATPGELGRQIDKLFDPEEQQKTKEFLKENKDKMMQPGGTYNRTLNDLSEIRHQHFFTDSEGNEHILEIGNSKIPVTEATYEPTQGDPFRELPGFNKESALPGVQEGTGRGTSEEQSLRNAYFKSKPSGQGKGFFQKVKDFLTGKPSEEYFQKSYQDILKDQARYENRIPAYKDPDGKVHSGKVGELHNEMEKRLDLKNVNTDWEPGFLVDGKFETNPLFQKSPEAIHGRFYEDEMGKLHVELAKTRNLSTYLHESSHAYLKILDRLVEDPNIPQEIKDQHASILKYLGAKPGEKLTTEQHEKFARSTEVYFATGKAPSIELQPAFRRYKAWLLAVYGDIKAKLGITLNKEAMDMFDRIYASKEEIQAAQDKAGMDDTFEHYRALGITHEQAQGWSKAVADAKAEAEEALTAKLVKEMKRPEQKAWKEERKDLVSENTKTLSESPIYKAKEALESGVDPQIVADELKTGVDELKAQVAHLPEIDVAAGHMADNTMKQRYGDTLNDGMMEQAAQDLVHSDKQAQVMIESMKLLAKKEFPKVKGMVKKITDPIPRLSDVKSHADEFIQGQKVSDIRPNYYKSAEAKAGKEAVKALLDGDIKASFDARKKQIFNHELYRAATETQKEIKSSLNFYKKLGAKDEDIAKTRDIDLVNAGRAILASRGIGKHQGDPMTYLENMKTYATEADTYANLSQLVTDATRTPGHYDALPFSEFQAMDTSVRALWELAQTMRQTEIDGKMQDRKEVIAGLNAQNQALLHPKFKMGLRTEWNQKPGESEEAFKARVSAMDKERISKGGHTPTNFEKHKVDWADLNAGRKIVHFWANDMDGTNKEKPYLNTFVHKIRDAANNFRTERDSDFEKLHEVIKPIEGKLERKPIHSPELNFTFNGTKEIMGAMSHTGNWSNFQKMLRGNGWGDWKKDANGEYLKGPDGKKVLDTSKWDAFVDRMHREGTITKDHHDTVQKIWDLYESKKEGVGKAYRRIYGYDMKWIEPREVDTPWGKQKGGYVPAKVDPYKNDDGKTRVEKEALEGQYNGFAWATTGKGATYERAENYAAPLQMDLGLIFNHLDWANRFIHIEPHVRELGRIVFDKDFTGSLKQVDPAAKTGLLVPWLQRSARQRTSMPSDSRFADNFFSGLRHRAGMVMLAGNLADTLTRSASIFPAAIKVGPTHLMSALLSYIRNPLDVAEANRAESKLMASGRGISGYDIKQGIDQVMDPSKWKEFRDWSDTHAYFLQSMVHHFLDNTVYLGAKNQALEEMETNHPGATGEEAMKLAVRDAEDKLIETQGSHHAEDISRLQTGTPFSQLFKMFWGYFNSISGLVGSEQTKVFRDVGLTQGAPRLLFAWTMGLMVPGLMYAFYHDTLGGRGVLGNNKDAKQDGISDYMKWMFGSMADQSLQMFSGAGSLVKGLARGKLEDNPIMSTIQSVARTVSGTNLRDLKHGKPEARKGTRDAFSTLGLFSGLAPFAWAARPLSYLAGLKNREYRPKNALDEARGFVSGSPGKR